MSGLRRLAARLHAFASAVAPRGRAKWLDAMQAEQAAGSEREALAWGLGSVRSATIWRLQEDGLFFAALLFVLLGGQTRLFGALVTPPRDGWDMQPFGVFVFCLRWSTSWAAPSLLLAALKPRWALMSALAVAFLEPDWFSFLLAIPRSVGGGARGVEGLLFFALPTLLSSLLGAGIGVLASRTLRRR